LPIIKARTEALVTRIENVSVRGRAFESRGTPSAHRVPRAFDPGVSSLTRFVTTRPAVWSDAGEAID
jgi:hypothetical protein